jgi:hypothetical protein
MPLAPPGLAAGAFAGWMKEEELLGVLIEDRGRLTDEFLAAACSPVSALPDDSKPPLTVAAKSLVR